MTWGRLKFWAVFGWVLLLIGDILDYSAAQANEEALGLPVVAMLSSLGVVIFLSCAHRQD